MKAVPCMSVIFIIYSRLDCDIFNLFIDDIVIVCDVYKTKTLILKSKTSRTRSCCIVVSRVLFVDCLHFSTLRSNSNPWLVAFVAPLLTSVVIVFQLPHWDNFPHLATTLSAL